MHFAVAGTLCSSLSEQRNKSSSVDQLESSKRLAGDLLGLRLPAGWVELAAGRSN